MTEGPTNVTTKIPSPHPNCGRFYRTNDRCFSSGISSMGAKRERALLQRITQLPFPENVLGGQNLDPYPSKSTAKTHFLDNCGKLKTDPVLEDVNA